MGASDQGRMSSVAALGLLIMADSCRYLRGGDGYEETSLSLSNNNYIISLSNNMAAYFDLLEH